MNKRLIIAVVIFSMFLASYCFAQATARPEWQIGNKWIYKYRNAFQVGIFTAEIAGREKYDASVCWVVNLALNMVLLKAEQIQYLPTDDLDTVALETKATIGMENQYTRKLILLDPPMITYLWPLEVGRVWTGTYEVIVDGLVVTKMGYEVKIESSEMITVIAGKFETFKIVEVTDELAGASIQKGEMVRSRGRKCSKGDFLFE